MIKFDKETKALLVEVFNKKNIALEGTILKLVEVSDDDPVFKDYIKKAIEADTTSRTKRLKITKQIQVQNNELKDAEVKNHKLMGELKR